MSAIQASYGVSFILTKKIKGTFEFKYVLTHDSDNHVGIPDKTLVDTSGHWTLFRFGPHLDTKYHMFIVGLQYALF